MVQVSHPGCVGQHYVYSKAKCVAEEEVVMEKEKKGKAQRPSTNANNKSHKRQKQKIAISKVLNPNEIKILLFSSIKIAKANSFPKIFLKRITFSPIDILNYWFFN